MDCASLRPNGEYLSPTEMDAITRATRVFARAKPEDKLEIVKSIQRQGGACEKRVRRKGSGGVVERVSRRFSCVLSCLEPF